MIDRFSEPDKYMSAVYETGLFDTRGFFNGLTGTNFGFYLITAPQNIYAWRFFGEQKDLTFREVFEQVPDELREKLFYHLDLFL